MANEKKTALLDPEALSPKRGRPLGGRNAPQSNPNYHMMISLTKKERDRIQAIADQDHRPITNWAKHLILSAVETAEA